MKQNILIFVIIAFGALCLAQLTIQVTNQCECSQFDQYTCGTLNNQQSCGWNATSNSCQSLGCRQLNNQTSCQLNFLDCWWDGSKCQQFSSCSNINSSQNLSCYQQNIQCSNQQNSTICVSLDNLPKCSQFNQTQCSLQQMGFQGTLCYWNNSTCQTAQSCTNFSQSQCSSLENLCIWNNNSNSCVQKQCGDYTFEQECKFVIEGLNPKTITPCQFVQGQCQSYQNAKSLNSQDCSQKTLQTYYWIQVSNSSGLCIPCMYKIPQLDSINQYQPNNECQCSNYLSEQCQQTDYCTWQNNTECNTLGCNQIKDQLSCIENLSCIWQNNTCQQFSNCPQAQTQQKCLGSSFNCPFFNFTSSQCTGLSSSLCLSQTTKDLCLMQLGYCYWSGYQCYQVQTCEQITSQKQCYRFGYSCMWYQNRCQSLTCASIQDSKNCIYTIPNLYTNDVQPCIWQSGKCQNLTDSNNLNATQCISNTLHTFKWTGSSCVSCSQHKNQTKLYLEIPNQCQCSQLYNEFDCSEQSSSCMWQNNYCQQLVCSNIVIQSNCASNKNCLWSGGQCVNFTSCGSLIGTSQSECIVQSINCPGSNGKNCTNTMSPCSSYSNQSLCTHVLGNNGFCIWQNGSCQILSKCSQLTQQNDCQQFQKQCYWSNNICQPVSCSIFTNPQTCQYYYSSINSYTPIPCYWNSAQVVCAQTTTYANQLTSATCSINTKQTARWSNTLKICLTCQAPQYPNPYRCACSQLISQINCMQSLECQWNTQSNHCQQQPCTGLTQSLCIQNSQCMWNNGSCQTFTSCTALSGGSSDECASQTLRCPYYNSKTNKCQAATLNNNLTCQDINNPQECFDHQSPYFQCSWNYNTNKCFFGDNCSYYDYQQCILSSICYYSNNVCQLKSCQNYTTKEQCTFIIYPTNWNYVQSCAWKNGACVAADNLFSENTCFVNTDQTGRWSTNNEDGYCIPCSIQFSQLLVPRNKCLCAQILTQYECNLANCYWNQGFCNESGCPQNQLQCVQKVECYWLYDSNYQKGGSCEFIINPIQQDFCTKLRGKNSLECLAQTTLCPVSIDGVCQSREHLQTCSSIESLQLCSNGIGQEGYCKYENQSCQILTSCSQITVQGECYLLDKACLWNVTQGICEQMTCASYSQTNCSFVYQNIDRANIVTCVWNGTGCASASYLIKQYSFQQCYQTTGGTYHWSNPEQSNGQCISCSLNRIKPKNACSCTDLNEIECTLSKPVCKLIQNNQCVKSECKEILDSVHCSQQNECMWQSNSCVPFTNCTELKGSSALDCMAQSLQCQSQSNQICQSASSLDSCSKYGSDSCHYGSIGSDGLCYWNTSSQVCQVISSCDKVNNQPICQSLAPACQWSLYFSSCVPFQCQDYPNEIQCKNVIVNLQDPQIMLCVWKNQKCQPYEDTYYRFDSAICFVQSDHTYRWIKEDKYGVRCQQCLSAYLINFIALATLIII
ncbi:unnamed protein product [Paramecium sonneborni]|uniref:Uncharacterized protein n=1 Tax=Paramecium sonneborni TaxID=65129 RepID=A0A8S1QVD1_9CILI|nr:unnamed protein product [Paramecium sonneborni]